MLTVVPVAALKGLVDLLADLGVDPLHLHTDGHTETRPPDFRLWLRTRTDFERVCQALAVKPKRSRWDPEGQRSYSATKDTDHSRLLIQVVSFAHHDDWDPTA